MDLENAYNFGYIGEFYLGSGEGQTRIRTMLDTGSANSWIVSKESVQKKKPADQAKWNAFDKSLSPTYREPEENDKQWTKINFGSGSLRGYFAHDQCTLGSLNDSSNQLVLDDYMFGLIQEENTMQDSFDAIIGMAYPEFAEPGVVPFFDSLMNAGIMGKNVFAFHMSMNQAEEKSELMLGGWDDSKYEGELKWHKVQHKLFWSIALDDVKVNGRSLGLCGGRTGK